MPLADDALCAYLALCFGTCELLNVPETQRNRQERLLFSLCSAWKAEGNFSLHSGVSYSSFSLVRNWIIKRFFAAFSVLCLRKEDLQDPGTGVKATHNQAICIFVNRQGKPLQF